MSQVTSAVLPADLEGVEFLPVPRTSATFAARVFAKVDASGDCWEWTGALDYQGYGVVGRGPRGAGKMQAYRAVWELLVGPIPDDMHYDHLCKNRACVNPDHGEIVTPLENWRRSYNPAVLATMRDTCLYGHPLDGVVPRKNGKVGRSCKTCDRESKRLDHCKNGHDFTPETVTITKNGRRYCRLCMSARGARRRGAELREAA